MSEEITMDSMNPQQVEREAYRTQANREELVERIARAIRKDGTAAGSCQSGSQLEASNRFT